jgi:hypothetical protein
MQEAGQQALGSGMFAGLMGVYCCTILVFYVYFSMCIMKIAQKLGVENAWLAWIPIINIWILIQCAGKEWWWILLFLIPIANIVAAIVIWMAIAERRGKPSWLGILMIVPIANLIIPGYLAFTD